MCSMEFRAASQDRCLHVRTHGQPRHALSNRYTTSDNNQITSRLSSQLSDLNQHSSTPVHDEGTASGIGGEGLLQQYFLGQADPFPAAPGGKEQTRLTEASDRQRRFGVHDVQLQPENNPQVCGGYSNVG